MPTHTILAIAVTPHGAVYGTQPDTAYVECDPQGLSIPRFQLRRRTPARGQQTADRRLGVRRLLSVLAAT